MFERTAKYLGAPLIAAAATLGVGGCIAKSEIDKLKLENDRIEHKADRAAGWAIVNNNLGIAEDLLKPYENHPRMGASYRQLRDIRLELAGSLVSTPGDPITPAEQKRIVATAAAELQKMAEQLAGAKADGGFDFGLKDTTDPVVRILRKTAGVLQDGILPSFGK